MRRFRRIKYPAAFALALALAAFAGCAWLGDALSALTPADTDLPLGSVLPTAVPDAAPTAASDTDNPVLVFITGYERAFASASKGLAAGAYERGGESGQLALLLARDGSRLSLIASTVGMLPDRSALGAFSGEVSGAYSGSGTLSKEGAFEFSLGSGGSIAGSLEKGVLTASLPDGELALYRTDSGYLLWFYDGQGTGVTEVLGSKLRYMRSDKKLAPSDRLPGGEGLSEFVWGRS